MKKFVYVILLAAMGISISCLLPVFAVETHEDTKLIGSWTLTRNSIDSSGNPCPYVPKIMKIFKDQTIILSNYGNKHLPYKTTTTTDERMIIEERHPILKGMNLLLIRPNPVFDWAVTPMVYGYSVKNNELILFLEGWSPAKFVRVIK